MRAFFARGKRSGCAYAGQAAIVSSQMALGCVPMNAKRRLCPTRIVEGTLRA
jgi:hypothetical protein